MLNGCEYKVNTRARYILFAEDDRQYNFCADTGSLTGLINIPTLQKEYPNVVVHIVATGGRLQLTGVGKGPEVSIYIEISPKLRTIDAKTITFPQIRCYLVDKLPGGVLLGLNFLKTNHLDFRYGRKATGRQYRLVKDTSQFSISNYYEKRKAKYIRYMVIAHLPAA